MQLTGLISPCRWQANRVAANAEDPLCRAGALAGVREHYENGSTIVLDASPPSRCLIEHPH